MSTRAKAKKVVCRRIQPGAGTLPSEGLVNFGSFRVGFFFLILHITMYLAIGSMRRKPQLKETSGCLAFGTAGSNVCTDARGAQYIVLYLPFRKS